MGERDLISCPRHSTRLHRRHNESWGGAIYDFAEIERMKEVCQKHQLAFHLDGARVFNALVETRKNYKEYAKHFDTISICLSKGLGAPVGSALIGSAEDIHRAQRLRKLMGGGMRQAGHLAAAGIYALHHHVERLKDDHRRALSLCRRDIASRYEHHYLSSSQKLSSRSSHSELERSWRACH